MTTLREWLDRLKTFDPDDWGDIEQLRASFSEEELGGDLEAEIAFDTVGGTVDHVVIRLIDNAQDSIVDLDYDILQLDVVPLTEFIRDAVFPDDESTSSSS
jgi:hypothetical protein